MAQDATAISSAAEDTSMPKGALRLFGRLFFALIFVMASANLFTKQGIAYAASQGVPLASVAVPLAGVLSLVGGLSILLGYRAKIGGWLTVLFLMLGGALQITQFGAGRFSVDARKSR